MQGTLRWIAIGLIREALAEPRYWIPTLSRRLGSALAGPPASLAKRLGPATAPLSLPALRPIKELTLRSAPRLPTLRYGHR